MFAFCAYFVVVRISSCENNLLGSEGFGVPVADSCPAPYTPDCAFPARPAPHIFKVRLTP